MDHPRYNPQSDNRPLSDEELAALDDLLAQLPGDAAMNIEALDGYLAALLLSPVPLAGLPGAAWLPTVWGGDGEPDPAPFTSGKQRKRLVMLVLRHVQSMAVQWAGHPQAWEPIFSIAEVPDEAAESVDVPDAPHATNELTDAQDWSAGFLAAVQLAPDAWAPLFDAPDTAALLAPIRLLGADESELTAQERALCVDTAQRDALSRAVPDAVLALYAARTEPAV